MTASERDTLEARLTALLRAEEVASVPRETLEAGLARVAVTAQRSGRFGFPDGSSDRRGRSVRRVVFAVAAALTLAAGLVGIGGSPLVDDSIVPPPSPSPSPSLSISTTMDLTFYPYSVSVGLGAVWMVGPINEYEPSGVLARVDTKSRKLTEFPVDVTGCSSTYSDWSRPGFGFGSVWLPDCGGDRIIRLDPETGVIQASFPSFVSPWDAPQDHLVAFDDVTAYLVRDTRVTAIDRVDVTTNVATPFMTLNEPTLDITIDGPSLWVTTASSISKVDLATRKVVATIPLEPRSVLGWNVSVIAVDGGLWVNSRNSVIVAVDRAVRRTTFDVGGPLRTFAFANGKVWTIRDVFTLVSIDPGRREVVESLPIAEGQGGLAADGATLWFAEYQGKRLIQAKVP